MHRDDGGPGQLASCVLCLRRVAVVVVKIVEGDVVHAFVISGCLNFQCWPERGRGRRRRQAKNLFHFGTDGGEDRRPWRKAFLDRLLRVCPSHSEHSSIAHEGVSQI